MDTAFAGLSLHHASFEDLPPELWDYILANFVPDAHLTRTALALLHALPHCRLSQANLWRHLRITREGQTAEISKRSIEWKATPRTVVVQAWREDPQALVDLLRTLPSLRSLSLSIGPLNTPEILDELFGSLPRFSAPLEELSLRFNPYVTERSYYTFLKVRPIQLPLPKLTLDSPAGRIL